MAAMLAISRVKSSELGAVTQGGSLAGICRSQLLNFFFIKGNGSIKQGGQANIFKHQKQIDNLLI